jgi:transposase
MRKSGHKLQEIADTLNIPRETVSDVVVRFKHRGSVENQPHTGRHRLLDERDTRVLVRLVRSDSVPLTFNSRMKLFSGPFHTLFPVNLSDPDFLLYNSPVVSS